MVLHGNLIRIHSRHFVKELKLNDKMSAFSVHEFYRLKYGFAKVSNHQTEELVYKTYYFPEKKIINFKNQIEKFVEIDSIKKVLKRRNMLIILNHDNLTTITDNKVIDESIELTNLEFLKSKKNLTKIDKDLFIENWYQNPIIAESIEDRNIIKGIVSELISNLDLSNLDKVYLTGDLIWTNIIPIDLCLELFEGKSKTKIDLIIDNSGYMHSQIIDPEIDINNYSDFEIDGVTLTKNSQKVDCRTITKLMDISNPLYIKDHTFNFELPPKSKLMKLEVGQKLTLNTNIATYLDKESTLMEVEIKTERFNKLVKFREGQRVRKNESILKLSRFQKMFIDPIYSSTDGYISLNLVEDGLIVIDRYDEKESLNMPFTAELVSYSKSDLELRASGILFASDFENNANNQGYLITADHLGAFSNNIVLGTIQDIKKISLKEFINKSISGLIIIVSKDEKYDELLTELTRKFPKLAIRVFLTYSLNKDNLFKAFYRFLGRFLFIHNHNIFIPVLYDQDDKFARFQYSQNKLITIESLTSSDRILHIGNKKNQILTIVNNKKNKVVAKNNEGLFKLSTNNILKV